MNARQKLTPLERQAEEFKHNLSLLRSLQSLKLDLTGLSKNSHEAFRNFLASVNLDLAKQRSQLDIYAADNDPAIVQDLNLWIEEKRQQESASQYRFACSRCRDNGFTDTVILGGKERKVYCKCKTGIKAASESEEYQERMSAQNRRKERVTIRREASEKINRFQSELHQLTWKYSDNLQFAICKHCGATFSNALGPPNWHVQKCKLLSAEALALRQGISDALKEFHGKK